MAVGRGSGHAALTATQRTESKAAIGVDVGTVASTGVLAATYTAADYRGAIAWVGGARYASDGTSWVLSLVSGDWVTLLQRLQRRGAVVGSVGDSITMHAESYIRRGVYKLDGFGALYEVSAAVSGAKTDAMLAQIASLPSYVNVVTCMGGSNDAATLSVAQHITNLKAIGAAVEASGKTFVLIACPPMDTLTSTINSYQYPEMMLCQHRGWSYFDPWQRLTEVTGAWVAGAASDGTHPTATSHLTAADDFATAVQAGQEAQWARWPRGPGDGVDTNPLMVTDTNSDGIPDNFSVLGASAPSYSLTTATYPKRGKIWQATFSQTATVDSFRTWNLASNGISVGDDIEIAAHLEIVSLTNARVRVWVERQGALPSPEHIRIFLYDSVTDGGRMVGGVTRVPALCTNLLFWIRTESVSGGVYAATFRLGGVNAYKRSAALAMAA